MKILIPQTLVGKRVDSALSELSGLSRSQIQQRIKQRLVHKDGQPVKNNERVREGEIFVVEEAVVVQSEKIPCSVDITEETEEYLVAHKPIGCVVHPDARHPDGTLADLICEKYPAIRKVGDDPQRPGIVHRLDKDASGVMIIAKTQDAFDYLKRLFKLRRVRKEYLIMVHGAITPLEGEIVGKIARSVRSHGRFVVSPEGKEARTRYWVEAQTKKYSLVRVQPETGRTHQIRVHFFSRGYPIVGDRLYRAKKNSMTTRLMLHAVSLSFQDPQGEMREYRVEPDSDFMRVVGDCMGAPRE
jgi:23S rRNA pseudouridine1911/1915/1917 synthase